MSQYKYDEEGGQFLTFVLTFLLLVLVPLTWTLLTGASTTASSISQSWFDKRGQKVSTIKSINRRSLTNPRISKTLVAVVAGWALAAYLFQRVANAAANSSHAVYDPFHILGLATSATEKEIKKHYKRLSIKFHPDKIRLSANQTKESVESHYIELTKAYKALTDDTIRKNFELYGHPDGRQEMSMGIALPTWVVESQNNIWVLGAYGVVFGVLMPYLVARWWYGSRAKTKDGVYTSTAQTFFQHLREDTDGPRIISILAICEEFQDRNLDRRGKDANEAALKELETQVRAKLKPFGPNWQLSERHRSPSIRKALILLYAYLFRIESKNASLNQQRYLAGSTAERLLDGMLQISLAHNWLNTTEAIMHAIQCFVQAVPICEDRRVAELLQLGGMQAANARQIVAKGGEAGRAGVQGFFALDEPTRKSCAGVKQEQMDHMMKVAGDWPRLELVDAFFKVEGERLVTSSAIVQFVVKVRTLPPKKDDVLLVDGRRAGPHTDGSMDIRSGVEDVDDSSSKQGKSSSDSSADSGKQTLGVARAPHFLSERKPHWWLLLGDSKQNRVIVQPIKFSDVGPDKLRTYTVQFQAPPNAGLYTFVAQIRSDSYLGSDASRYVQLKVEEPSVLEEEEGGEIEDDISEPDEDTLAGQMAMMRGGKVKPSPVHGDDDDDSEGEEGDEEDSEPSDSDTDEE
ncbi:hypothetical protein BDZ90DRAFT_280462 [Jaminaea rosea]|uniref:J domain-containing protein n=1 Tax=Jaminaea rosea TaxID=1569628 RepID=A0A316UMA4_9BASI|nr:hypothetical protein BDZ90DRAFT_280462 [Jaminaea rosea]PWN26422.1 hypothetical protein BDZ90DRAFT_280462 [Jaminaea rosea]